MMQKITKRKNIKVWVFENRECLPLKFIIEFLISNIFLVSSIKTQIFQKMKFVNENQESDPHYLAQEETDSYLQKNYPLH